MNRTSEMSWRDYLLAENPSSPAQARLRQAYLAAHAFARNRLAMDGELPDGTKLDTPPRSRAQGFNSVLTTTHRQNFLVPPRRHRSFPLSEL